MKESSEGLNFGKEWDERFDRKRELNKEIIKINSALHMLRKQKQIPVVVSEITRLETELKELEEELAVIEKIKY